MGKVTVGYRSHAEDTGIMIGERLGVGFQATVRLWVGGVRQAITVGKQAVVRARVSPHAPFTKSLRGPQSGWVEQGEVGLRDRS